MLLTITLSRTPATDLGYLLHKHPAHVQSFELSFGSAHVWYTEASEERCTAALLLDVDPVGLVRRAAGALTDYVTDRGYVCSSFLSVAIARVYRTALGGRCEARPELAASVLPLEATLAVVRGTEDLVRRLFEPLGYAVGVHQHPLDPSFPEWGTSPYLTVEMSAELRLADMLAHLYVLVPVLDRDKHYFIGDDEVSKLLRRGEGWLATHPERTLITHRYLKGQRSLARQALERLVVEDDEPDSRDDAAVDETMRLHDARIGAVMAVLRGCGAKRVLDLGCGEGKLIRELIREPGVSVTGVDVSVRSLERARDRLKVDRLPPGRVEFLHGSLIYRDARLEGFDAAAVVEVVEHLDPPRLRSFERVLFGCAQPRTVVLTTPNREYDVLFEGLPAGSLRHRDHRFEWTRDEFHAWSHRVADEHGYRVRFVPVGAVDPVHGPPSQMAVFER